MKKKIIFLLACMLMMIPGIANAKTPSEPGPPCECDDNLCSNCGAKALFTICDKRSRNCTEINTDTINNNKKYDLFEIKDKEIYLDNSEINLGFNSIWSLLNYKMHISGTNKITYLDSFNIGKNSISARMYPNLYTSDYIPFTVEGDGTLEIEVANQIKKNAEGETYYKCWMLDVIKCEFSGRNIIAAYEVTKSAKEAEAAGDSIKDTKTVNNVKKINVGDVHLLRQTNTKAKIPVVDICLTEAEINTSDNTVTFTIPKYGYTVSDIKRIFGSNAESFYRAAPGESMTMQDFNERAPELLKSYAQESDNMLTADGRRAFIDKLIQNGRTDNEAATLPSCGTPYLVSSNSVTEETQITSAWGEEYIKTDLRRSFSSDGHYLINFPEEKNMIKSTKKDNIVFESTEEFDPNYHLVVDDITEKITDIQSASVQAKTDKTLVELYDIYMADENDNIVKMENGTYKIKIELNDLLKKYENYQIIYIGDDNKVELIDATVEDNYITFNTTHLSKYGVVGKEIRKTGNIITNPQTADSVVTYGLMLVSLAVAIALVVLRIRKLKRD